MISLWGFSHLPAVPEFNGLARNKNTESVSFFSWLYITHHIMHDSYVHSPDQIFSLILSRRFATNVKNCFTVIASPIIAYSASVRLQHLFHDLILTLQHQPAFYGTGGRPDRCSRNTAHGPSLWFTQRTECTRPESAETLRVWKGELLGMLEEGS